MKEVRIAAIQIVWEGTIQALRYGICDIMSGSDDQHCDHHSSDLEQKPARVILNRTGSAQKLNGSQTMSAESKETPTTFQESKCFLYSLTTYYSQTFIWY
jgi:hypothetical protein